MEFDLKMKEEHRKWSTPPNDCRPYDMENEDFMQYLINLPRHTWTKHQLDWADWWSHNPMRKK